MPRGIRSTQASNSNCTTQGCDEPRMVSRSTGRLLTMCEAHQREYWRKQAAKQRDTDKPRRKRRQAKGVPIQRNTIRRSQQPASVCSLCHRTSARAAIFALHHDIYCSNCTPFGSNPMTVSRRVAAADDGTPALLVDAENSRLQRVQVQVIGDEPMPAEASLRLKLLEASHDDLMILRRHHVTKGSRNTHV